MGTIEATPTTPRLARWLIGIFGIWCVALFALITLVQALTHDPVVRAVLRMTMGVCIFWILGAGLASLALREPATRWFQRRERWWQGIFILGATGLALVEEAVTTTMTNLAPLWGVSSHKAMITASGNYLDVVLLHSVIVFIPMFVAWSWLLRRYAFPPAMVFLLFGTTGVLAEGGTFGFNPVEIGFWIYVYGLMVFLPAYAAPPSRPAKSPGVGAMALAIVLPIVAAIPVVIIVQAVHAHFFATLP
jgi:hypothetical protein